MSLGDLGDNYGYQFLYVFCGLIPNLSNQYALSCEAYFEELKNRYSFLYDSVDNIKVMPKPKDSSFPTIYRFRTKRKSMSKQAFVKKALNSFMLIVPYL